MEDYDDIQVEIDYLISGVIQTQFDRAIDAFTVKGAEKPGAALRGVIDKYINLGQLGSKKGERVKDFFQNIIRRKIEELRRAKDASRPCTHDREERLYRRLRRRVRRQIGRGHRRGPDGYHAAFPGPLHGFDGRGCQGLRRSA